MARSPASHSLFPAAAAQPARGRRSATALLVRSHYEIRDRHGSSTAATASRRSTSARILGRCAPPITITCVWRSIPYHAQLQAHRVKTGGRCARKERGAVTRGAALPLSLIPAQRSCARGAACPSHREKEFAPVSFRRPSSSHLLTQPCSLFRLSWHQPCTAAKSKHTHRAMRKVLFQPDYFMSPQFAGLAVALRTGRCVSASTTPPPLSPTRRRDLRQVRSPRHRAGHPPSGRRRRACRGGLNRGACQG